MIKPLNFIFIGRSGCGKGTQVELLKKEFANLISISTGDLMRDLAKADSQVGKKIKAVLAVGGLPFDDIATTLWMYEIAYTLKKDQGLICDGFPRRLNEAQNLNNFFEWLERKSHTLVLLLDISRKEATRRLKLRARKDDHDLEIKNRLDYFEERVVPAIDYYKKQGMLYTINAELSIEQVFKQILKAIDDFNQKQKRN